jgi:SET domain-containing protein
LDELFPHNYKHFAPPGLTATKSVSARKSNMKDLTYRSPKTEVKDSPIHGKGLFAKEAISAGEIVAVKGGHILTRQEWATFERSLGSAEIQISEDLFIAPVEQARRDGSMLYTNHSCDPNIAIQGQIVFVAMRDIAPGEELTHDWATADDLDYEMECKCGSPNCRGVVTGKDWMKKELQERYEGWFCWFLQRKIEALK